MFLTDAVRFFGGAAKDCMIDNSSVVVAGGTGKNAVMAPEMVAFATRFGGRRILWTETYGLEANEAAFRQRFGATITQFIALRAPEFVLVKIQSIDERLPSMDDVMRGRS